MTDLKQPEGIIAITDNGGETLDRYTVWLPDGMYLGLNTGGLGFSQFGYTGCAYTELPDAEINWEDLDDSTKRHIIGRLKED